MSLLLTRKNIEQGKGPELLYKYYKQIIAKAIKIQYEKLSENQSKLIDLRLDLIQYDQRELMGVFKRLFTDFDFTNCYRVAHTGCYYPVTTSTVADLRSVNYFVIKIWVCAENKTLEMLWKPEEQPLAEQPLVEPCDPSIPSFDGSILMANDGTTCESLP